MKIFLTILCALICASATAQDRNIREATAAEVTAGTIGLPAVLTPRRAAGAPPAAGAVTTNMVIAADTNALNFIYQNNITDPKVRSDIIGAVNDMKASGIFSRIREIVLFYPRFNPTNPFTFFGRSILYTNAAFTKWGLNLQAGNTTAEIDGLPDCRTNTQVYVWHVPKSKVDQNTPCRYLGGLVNKTANQSLYFCANTIPSQRIRVVGTENAHTGNGQNAWILYNTILGYNYLRSVDLYTRGNKITSGFCYDGSSMSGFQDYLPVKIDQLAPTLSTNYALSGLQITVPLTNWLIGKDYIVTNITNPSQCDMELGVILNGSLSSAEWKNLVRGLRWFDPDDEDLIILADSLFSNSADSVFTPTNAPIFFLKNATEANTNIINIQDLSISGDAVAHFSPLGISDSAWTNWSGPFDAGFFPSAKVRRHKVAMILGFNDITGGGTFTSFAVSNVMAVAALAMTNNVELAFGLDAESATNSSVIPETETIRLNRYTYNTSIISNAFYFSRVMRFDLMVDQAILKTNIAAYTYDGLHPFGALGWILNQKKAGLVFGQAQKIASDYTPIAVTASPMSWTNFYSGPVIFAVVGGTLDGLTNSIPLTVNVGTVETTLQPGDVIQLGYTVAPSIYWKNQPGYTQ